MKAVKTAVARVGKPKNPMTAVRVAQGIRDVEQYTGLTRVTIWKLCTRNQFPQPHYVLGHRKWWKDDIERWVAEQNEANVQPAALNTKRVAAPAKARKGGGS